MPPRKIKLSAKTGIPVLEPGDLPHSKAGSGGGASEHKAAEGGDDEDSVLPPRPPPLPVEATRRRKGETAEEKRARKKAVKEARKVRPLKAPFYHTTTTSLTAALCVHVSQARRAHKSAVKQAYKAEENRQRSEAMRSQTAIGAGSHVLTLN